LSKAEIKHTKWNSVEFHVEFRRDTGSLSAFKFRQKESPKTAVNTLSHLLGIISK